MCPTLRATQKKSFWSQHLRQKAVMSVEGNTLTCTHTHLLYSPPSPAAGKPAPPATMSFLWDPPRRISAAKWPGLHNLVGGHESRTACSAWSTIKLMSLSVQETSEDRYTGLCWGLYGCACGWEWVGTMGRWVQDLVHARQELYPSATAWDPALWLLLKLRWFSLEFHIYISSIMGFGLGELHNF